MLDLVVGRIGILLEQLRHHHDEARRAVAALEGARFDEGLLHRAQLVAGVEALDRRYLGAVDELREIETAGYGFAVDHDSAAAAQALAAGFPRPGQAELRLQELDEVMMRLDVGYDRRAVQREGDGSGCRGHGELVNSV